MDQNHLTNDENHEPYLMEALDVSMAVLRKLLTENGWRLETVFSQLLFDILELEELDGVDADRSHDDAVTITKRKIGELIDAIYDPVNGPMMGGALPTYPLPQIDEGMAWLSKAVWKPVTGATS